MPQNAGARWQTKERQGISHREAGKIGGRGHRWKGGGPGLGHAPATRQEVALRWFMGDATQIELALEYEVSRSTVRRWVVDFSPSLEEE